MSIRGKVARLANRLLEPMGARVVGRSESCASFPYIQELDVCGTRYSLWVADETAREWFDPEVHALLPENQETTKLVGWGDQVLEIGAHQGFYTVLLAKLVGPQGRVFAIEASPLNTMVLSAQITLNHEGAICRVMNAVASDSQGELELSREPNAHVLRKHQADSIRVKAVTADEIDAEFGPYNVLKVDVEGFEGGVLCGCRQILARAPKLSLEIHTFALAQYGTSVKKILEQIGAERYEGVMIPRQQRMHVLPFHPEEIEKYDIVNLFLRPRANA